MSLSSAESWDQYDKIFFYNNVNSHLFGQVERNFIWHSKKERENDPIEKAILFGILFFQGFVRCGERGVKKLVFKALPHQSKLWQLTFTGEIIWHGKSSPLSKWMPTSQKLWKAHIWKEKKGKCNPYGENGKLQKVSVDAAISLQGSTLEMWFFRWVGRKTYLNPSFPHQCEH